ncbi:MAG: phosphotransferase family protein [Myxococcota bacterium]|nr:phosphotransferase family protein [Myxococcales bacterium]
MSIDPESVRAPFAKWLSQRWPDVASLRVGAVQSPKSGFSAQTLILPVEGERAGVPFSEKVVLRIESPEPAVYPQQAPGLDCEVEIQFRAMAAVAATGVVPLAPLIGFEGDASVLGAPFFAMGFVEGEVPIENPIYTAEGFFVDATPAERARLVEEGLCALAALHSLDWRAAGFGWLVPDGEEPTVERQVDIWERYARRELDGRAHPLIDRALAWMRANRPAPPHPPTLSWGDCRPGNVIWRDFRPLALTDFENVAVAPPEFDLGWWLMFDRWSHEAYGQPRLEGEPTRAEQVAIYERAAGRSMGDTFYYELIGAFRYAAIVVRVSNRLVERGLLPADQTLWLQNPASTCLEQMLDEVGA